MILPWLLYAFTVTALLAVAAGALEGVVRQRNWPVRGLWMSALAGALLLPLLPVFFQSRPAPSLPPTAPAAVEHALPPAVADVGEARAWDEFFGAVSAWVQNAELDPWVLGLWGTASVAVALFLASSHLALAQRRREWSVQDLDGRMVLVSKDLGPAVVGVLPARIVVPEWVLRAEPGERALILAHEEEHIRAGDTRLLLGTLLLWVILPWNLALWWIWQSLRRAVEIDCDLRVLARGVDPRAYGRLLIGVNERGSAHRLLVAALSESPSYLERRIHHMFNSRSQRWWLRACGAAMFAGVLLLAACRLDRPESLQVVTAPADVEASSVQADTLPADELVTQGGAALQANRFAEAERLLAMAFERAEGDLRGRAAFFWGYSLYKQGEEIGKAQTTPEAAQRALALFQEARLRLQQATHPQAPVMIQSAEDWIRTLSK